jgi:hypothetical protein
MVRCALDWWAHLVTLCNVGCDRFRAKVFPHAIPLCGLVPLLVAQRLGWMRVGAVAAAEQEAHRGGTEFDQQQQGSNGWHSNAVTAVTAAPKQAECGAGTAAHHQCTELSLLWVRRLRQVSGSILLTGSRRPLASKVAAYDTRRPYCATTSQDWDT